jgi:hypothetical protein
VAAGLAPLAAYNQWAFGSVTHLSYRGELANFGGETLPPGFGLGWPQLRPLGSVLFSSMGLVTLTPLMILGLAGIVVLWRRHGSKAEAAVIAAVALGYPLYVSGIREWSPYGGIGPARYLIVTVPFLVLAAAPLVRRMLPLVLALGMISVAQMTAITSASPLSALDGDYIGRVSHHAFSQAASQFVGVTGWYAIAPFFVGVAMGLVGAWLSIEHRASGLGAALAAVGAVGLWSLLEALTTVTDGRRLTPGEIGAVAALGLAGAILPYLREAAKWRAAPTDVMLEPRRTLQPSSQGRD